MSVKVVIKEKSPINLAVNQVSPINLAIRDSIPLHSQSHESGGNDSINHNSLSGLQGGGSGDFYHLNADQYLNLATGDVVRPSDIEDFVSRNDTDIFYPTSNPSGYITTNELDGYVTGEVVRPSDTGVFSDYVTFEDLNTGVTQVTIGLFSDLGNAQFNVIDPESGDILKYNNAKWINEKAELLTDGGNF
jgi:hypothetical protein